MAIWPKLTPTEKFASVASTSWRDIMTSQKRQLKQLSNLTIDLFFQDSKNPQVSQTTNNLIKSHISFCILLGLFYYIREIRHNLDIFIWFFSKKGHFHETGQINLWITQNTKQKLTFVNYSDDFIFETFSSSNRPKLYLAVLSHTSHSKRMFCCN